MFSTNRTLLAASVLALAGSVTPAFAATPAPDSDNPSMHREFGGKQVKRMSRVPRDTSVVRVSKGQPSTQKADAPKVARENGPAKKIKIIGENTSFASGAPAPVRGTLAKAKGEVTRQSSVAQRVSEARVQTKVVTQSSLAMAQGRAVTNSSEKVREGRAIGRTSQEIRENTNVTRTSRVIREQRSSPTSPTVMRVAPAGGQQNASRQAKAMASDVTRPMQQTAITNGTRRIASQARKVAPKPAVKGERKAA